MIDGLTLGERVVISDKAVYGDLGIGTVVGVGHAVGKPVVFVKFPGFGLVKLFGYARYTVNKVVARMWDSTVELEVL